MRWIKINTKSFIENELIKLNYCIGNLGTVYLIEIIYYLSTKKNYMKYVRNLERTTYVVIAKRFDVNIGTFMSCIRKASMTANNSRTQETNMVLTPKNVIIYVLEKIK